MYDIAGWIERVRSFTRELPSKHLAGTLEVNRFRVEPPLSEEECLVLERTLKRPLPAALRTFLTAGSRHCDCRYVFTPSDEVLSDLQVIFPYQTYIYGGANLCHVDTMPRDLATCLEWAEEIIEEPEQQTFWLKTLPFASIANGDYLGLDTSQHVDDPPIIYLAHDADSRYLSQSFTEFLQTWERLCYIGPEIWLLAEFDGESGHINAEGTKASLLRKLLGIRE